MNFVISELLMLSFCTISKLKLYLEKKIANIFEILVDFGDL